MRSIRLLAILFLLAVPASASALDVTVRAKDTGRGLSIAKGDRVIVRLTECRPCGFQWRTPDRPNPNLFGRTSDRYVNGRPIGAPGKRVVVYRALNPGSTFLRMSYVGPDGTTAKRLSVKLTVLPTNP